MDPRTLKLRLAERERDAYRAEALRFAIELHHRDSGRRPDRAVRERVREVLGMPGERRGQMVLRMGA